MDDARLKKLRFRAWHRGFREADLILGPFADAHLAQLSADQLDAFEALIEQPDPDLYAWIIGSAPTPEAFDGEVLDLIRSFRFFAHTVLGADHGG
ncbi:MAG TPA: succinate dehydrogenase assembly factor 2 [Caulobacteraceae bacterium]|nr:succinate dehydrogenase assembly factor 2 [Caulobacteraceae bacterium]